MKRKLIWLIGISSLLAFTFSFLEFNTDREANLEILFAWPMHIEFHNCSESYKKYFTLYRSHSYGSGQMPPPSLLLEFTETNAKTLILNCLCSQENIDPETIKEYFYSWQKPKFEDKSNEFKVSNQYSDNMNKEEICTTRWTLPFGYR